MICLANCRGGPISKFLLVKPLFLSHKLRVFSKSTNVGNSLKMTRTPATLGALENSLRNIVESALIKCHKFYYCG